MISHSMYRPITALVMPLIWCLICKAHRPAAGDPGLGWRCQGCGELHEAEPAAVSPTTPIKEISHA